MNQDIKNIINTAKSFYYSAERSEEKRPLENNKYEILLVPAVTNRAFCIELYLKAFLLEENNPKKGHKLHELFKDLKTETKEKIINLCGLPKDEVINKLHTITNLFIEWRYIFESNSASLNFNFLKTFSLALKKIAETK